MNQVSGTSIRRLSIACIHGGVLLALLLALGAGRASAQANRGTITGTVTDTSGAVVSGAAVKATNQATGVFTTTTSNAAGIYLVPNVEPGAYSVEFTHDGFDTLLRSSISVNATEEVRIDATLNVGKVSSTVTVTDSAPVLDLDTASVGTNMKGSVVTDLPLSIYGGGRFVEDFAVAITPGYSPMSSPYGAVVNGGQWFTKDYTIDGTSGTSSVRGDSMDGGPSMEAVEELQAQTSGLDAESSITGGGVMSFNLKSGTNKLHGSAFLYGHNELLDANTWTNDSVGLPKPKERAWDDGFSLGGPIFKNKTFFFGTFERFESIDFRLNGGGASVPTPAFLKGDFSGLLGGTLCSFSGSTDLCSNAANYGTGPGTPITVTNNAGQTVQAQENMIYDPTTGNQFTDNIIPSNRISPVAQKINSFYSNYAPELGGLDNNLRTLIANTPSQTPIEVVVKIDHNLRQQDRLSGSWIYDHKPRTLDDGGGLWQQGSESGGPLSNARVQMYRQQQWRLSEAHTFTPRLLNVLNLTWNFDFNGSDPADPGNWNSQVGFGDTGASNFPQISFSDNGSYGHTETFLGSTWQGNTSGVNVTTGDTVTWTKGRHALTFGGDFNAHQINSHSGTGAYSFGFSYLNTAGPGYPYDGFGFATYMLGLVNQATDTVPYNLYGRQKSIDLFAQDSYKVTSKLTANLGLRWTYNTRFHEKYGNWANFDPAAISPTYGIPGALVFAKGGGDSFEKDEYALNFGPSLGLAYQFSPKVVVHASYGLIFNPVGVTFFSGVPDGFAPQLGSSAANNFSWDAPGGGGQYPGVFTKATTSTDPSTMTPFPVEMDPHALRLGYSEAFNVGIQQQLTPNTRLEISYVGNRGHRLTDAALAWNEGTTSSFLSLVNKFPDLNGYNHYVCSAADAAAAGVPYPYAGFCAPALSALAPFPQMASAEVNYWYYANLQYAGLPLGQSFYDSMIVDVVKRAGRGLTMDMSYDWSRQEGDSYSAQQEGNGFYTPVEDFSKMSQAAHSITGYDLANVVKGFASYQLPFGRGQLWMGSPNRVVNGIVGGWTLAGTVSYYTGQPFAIGASNPYWPLWGNIYPVFNLTGYKGPSNPHKYVPIGGGSAPPTSNFYMPTSVATNPAPGVLPPRGGTSALRCPGQGNENSTILKNVQTGPEGSYRISFRVDFYNLLNRHYYNINGCGGSHAAVGASDFGEILGVSDNPRQGQFAVRLDF
ncbi:MAG TPA: TonB-dependent receptor [Acidobacteriaceae bacterium]|nr:TonB-dependent receptor [Acidobacteriaceae bacterium]